MTDADALASIAAPVEDELLVIVASSIIDEDDELSSIIMAEELSLVVPSVETEPVVLEQAASAKTENMASAVRLRFIEIEGKKQMSV